MPKISVIANFYNSEKYIPKLINSIISQTYQDWELICVNDCSPQNDLSVILSFAVKENRIKIVNNHHNLGITGAKFEGIKKATGKYLMFIDGDDWLESRAFEECIKKAEQYDVDMVIMSYQRIYNNFYKTKIIRKANRIITQPELFEKYYINFFGVNLFEATYWGKLIKRSIIQSTTFHFPTNKKDYYCEDLIFNMYLFPNLKSMCFLDYIGYNWRFGGLTSGIKKESLNSISAHLNYILAFYQERLNLLRQYNYNKGFKTLAIELVNYLYCDLAKIAVSKTPSKEIIHLISNYNNVIQANIKYLTVEPNDKWNPILKNDVNAIYENAHLLYNQDWEKRIIKRFINCLN